MREGIERDRIYITGNPIKEVLDHFSDNIDNSPRPGELRRTGLLNIFSLRCIARKMSTMRERLQKFFNAFTEVANKFDKPILISVHPRTAAKLEQFGVRPGSDKVKLLKALGFFDFVKLEKNSLAVMTDSGTVQEECAIFGIPNITLRDVTERPETIECGSNILCGAETDSIVRAAELAIAQPAAGPPRANI